MFCHLHRSQSFPGNKGLYVQGKKIHLMLITTECLTQNVHSFHQPKTTCLFSSLTSFIPCRFAGGCWLAVSRDSPHLSSVYGVPSIHCLSCILTACTFQLPERYRIFEDIYKCWHSLPHCLRYSYTHPNQKVTSLSISLMFQEITGRTSVDLLGEMAGKNSHSSLELDSR